MMISYCESFQSPGGISSYQRVADAYIASLGLFFCYQSVDTFHKVGRVLIMIVDHRDILECRNSKLKRGGKTTCGPWMHSTRAHRL